jgi:ribosome recycling factor
MIAQVTDDLRRELEETIVAFRKELSRTRTGRAAPALVENIVVDYYGSRTPLIQLAGISAPEPRLLVIQPYDKGAMSLIEKALLQSDLGLTPMNDGKLIRLPIPELTEERRREFVKHCRKVAEDFRVSIRSHRRDAIDLLKSLEKDKEITEDDQRRGQELVQKLTDEHIKHVDEILTKKEAEIMEV